ncbi:hypothetical protein C8R43DRAFT_1133250 [Mycena crocata]|nr:hypothetical protein C8R43DRAFT_1133250 [Mycena crocata]
MDEEQLRQLGVLRDRIAGEMARRGSHPEDQDATRSGDASPSDVDAPQGSRRLREDDIEQDDFGGGIMDTLATGPYSLEEGRAYKRQKNLSSQSNEDAELFLRTINPMRHIFQLVVVALQCRDLLQVIKSDQDKKYMLPETLTTTCQHYAQAAILSAKAKSYRNIKEGPSVASSILAAMRMLGVMDLPPPSETGRCEVVLKCIGKALIDRRHLIKSQIFASLAIGKDGTRVNIDIAKLTRSCISASPVQPTVAMYQRIAFIRQVAADFLNKASSPTSAKSSAADENFWLAVDNQLALLKNLSALERKTLCEIHYTTDIELYGAADSEIPITLMKDMQSWLTTVDMVLEK